MFWKLRDVSCNRFRRNLANEETNKNTLSKTDTRRLSPRLVRAPAGGWRRRWRPTPPAASDELCVELCSYWLDRRSPYTGRYWWWRLRTSTGTNRTPAIHDNHVIYSSNKHGKPRSAMWILGQFHALPPYYQFYVTIEKKRINGVCINRCYSIAKFKLDLFFRVRRRTIVEN